MKYIKIFEDILDVNYEEIGKIEDLFNTTFLELKDEDFNIRTEIRIEDFGSNYIRLDIFKKEDFFYYEISDRVSMFIDWIKSQYKNVNYSFYYYDFSKNDKGNFINTERQTNKKEIKDNLSINELVIYIRISNKKLNIIQRFIKKFEGFDMNKSVCDRCSKPTNGITIMSQFNEDIICQDCKKLEKEDPDYELACSIERAEIRKGNTNFKGAFPNYKPLN